MNQVASCNYPNYGEPHSLVIQSHRLRRPRNQSVFHHSLPSRHRGQVFGLTCIRPVIAGPKSDSTPFQASVTIYMHNARAGRLSGNTVFWRCSAFDLDGERPRADDCHCVVSDNGTETFSAPSL